VTHYIEFPTKGSIMHSATKPPHEHTPIRKTRGLPSRRSTNPPDRAGTVHQLRTFGASVPLAVEPDRTPRRRAHRVRGRLSGAALVVATSGHSGEPSPPLPDAGITCHQLPELLLPEERRAGGDRESRIALSTHATHMTPWAG
jgi:hypothetical protein